MTSFDLKIDPRIDSINLKDSIEKSLIQSGYIVSGKAKELSPYRSGNLRRSIQPDFTEVSTNRTAIVGSNAKYARIQELGGTIRPTKAKYLSWKSNGKWHRAKEVTIKGKFYLSNALQSSGEQIYNTFLKNITNEL